LRFFRGRELQDYLTNLLDNNLKALIKVQYIDEINNDPKIAKVIVGKRLESVNKKGNLPNIVECLDLQNILEKKVGELSNGEIQRFVIAMTCI
jgi:ATP-binding cassette, sub-family E, member 1